MNGILSLISKLIYQSEKDQIFSDNYLIPSLEMVLLSLSIKNRKRVFITMGIALVFLLNSCATLLNGPHKRVEISTNPDDLSLQVEVTTDSSAYFVQGDSAGNNTDYLIPRSQYPITIFYKNGNTYDTLIVPAKESVAYKLNICSNLGIGMLIDKNRPERYTYPKHIYIESTGLYSYKKPDQEIQRGALRLNLDWSIVNLFYIKSSTSHNVDFGGAGGVEGGFDYYYKKNRFVSLNIGVASDIFLGPQGGVEGSSSDTSCVVYHLNLRHNHAFNKYAFGYGLSYSSFIWSKNILPYEQLRTTSFGFSLYGQYNFTKSLGANLLYQPAFININSSAVFDYQHFISLGLFWKITLLKGRN